MVIGTYTAIHHYAIRFFQTEHTKTLMTYAPITWQLFKSYLYKRRNSLVPTCLSVSAKKKIPQLTTQTDR